MKSMNLLPRLSLVLFFITTVTLHADPDALISEAWRAWERGDRATAEQKFNQAAREDPKSPRAHIGLSFLYSVQHDQPRAWQAYRSALENVSARHPYLYAAWSTPRFYSNLAEGDDARKLLESLAGEWDPTGTLHAMANESMANFYRYLEEEAKARQHADAMNCITDWQLIGPFENISGSGHGKAFPPEQGYDPNGRYAGKTDVPTTWFKPVAMRRDHWVDFTYYFAYSDATFYANTFVYSPAEQSAHLRLGTSGSFKAFLNDELVNEMSEEYNNDLDTYITGVTLQPGWNRVLIKCGYSDITRCNFMLRITDAEGKPLQGMKISSDPQQYKSRPGARATPVENFAEAFFRKEIAQHPDRIENYILLAECYLRNDKANDAELALRDALKLSPNSPLLQERLIEAYQRGGKDDEITKAQEKIYAIDKTTPTSLYYKFGQHMKNEEYDKAEQLLRQCDTLIPGSLGLYAMWIRFYGERELIEKAMEVLEKGYEQYPRSSEFTMMKAYLAVQTSHKPESALRFYEDYLEDGIDESILQSMADIHLGLSDLRKWRSTMERLIALNPATPTYYLKMAQTYSSANDYANAEDLLKKAIAICPNSSYLWDQLGEIYRTREDTAAALEALNKALLYSPTNYDARSTIRELTGKRAIYEQFGAVDVDSIVNYAHTMEADPDELAVILFDNAQHVIYNGASESSHDLVVKVLNGRGIDEWKEYGIPYNSYNEVLTIDKAVVVKADGSETEADISDGYVVFKALEENDVIRMKWRLKNHYSGKLSNHFFDLYYFNSFYPTHHVRYELLVPKDFKFNYKAQNMKVEPMKREVEDGVIYSWTMDDLPAISYEYGMPTLGDVGSILHISSIDSWEYMVEWYADIASARSKTSYEIKEQMRELLKGKESASDEEKMETIYNFITENIRYSSVAFRQGSHIPQKARDVLVNKIGDCKDVAALCIAMLREAGMKAHYVLVNTRDEGMNREILPSSLAFNHCIVGVETGTGIRYLDLTANNYPIGSTPEGDIGAFALVVKPGVKEPIYLPSTGTVPRTLKVRSDAEVGVDNTLRGKWSTTATGTVAAGFRNSFRDQAKKEQEKAVLANLSSTFENVRLSSFSLANLNNLASDVRMDYEFEVPDYLTEAGDFKLFKMPWIYYIESDRRALSYEKREYPYVYWPSEDTLVEEITVRLPDGYAPVELPPAVKYTSRIADYSMKYDFSGGKLIARRTFINKKHEVAPEEYIEFKGFHNNVVKEDERQILLKKKGKK